MSFLDDLDFDPNSLFSQSPDDWSPDVNSTAAFGNVVGNSISSAAATQDWPDADAIDQMATQAAQTYGSADDGGAYQTLEMRKPDVPIAEDVIQQLPYTPPSDPDSLEDAVKPLTDTAAPPPPDDQPATDDTAPPSPQPPTPASRDFDDGETDTSGTDQTPPSTPTPPAPPPSRDFDDGETDTSGTDGTQPGTTDSQLTTAGTVGLQSTSSTPKVPTVEEMTKRIADAQAKGDYISSWADAGSHQCVALVKTARPDLGSAHGDWKQGEQVTPDNPNIKPGDALATGWDKNGNYPNNATGNHAVYVTEVHHDPETGNIDKIKIAEQYEGQPVQTKEWAPERFQKYFVINHK